MQLVGMADDVFVLAGALVGVAVLCRGVKHLLHRSWEGEVAPPRLLSGLWLSLLGHSICRLAASPDYTNRVWYGTLSMIFAIGLWSVYLVARRKKSLSGT